MLPEVLRQRIEQFGVRWLYGPGRGRRIGRILPREVEAKWRIDNALSHDFRPEKIYRGAGKLGVCSEQTGECLSFGFLGTGVIFFTRQQEGRRQIGGISRRTKDTLRRQIIA